MSTLFAGPIEKRVMKVVRAKIATAEKEYDERCKALDSTCEQEVKDAETRRDAGKETAADDLVNDITAKFL